MCIPVFKGKSINPPKQQSLYIHYIIKYAYSRVYTDICDGIKGGGVHKKLYIYISVLYQNIKVKKNPKGFEHPTFPTVCMPQIVTVNKALNFSIYLPCNINRIGKKYYSKQ